MVMLRVFVAGAWFIGVTILSINFLYEEPAGPGAWFIIVGAIVYTTLKLIEDAIDAVDGIQDRQPQI